MKIIINDVVVEEINNNVIHKEKVIKNRLKKNFPEINIDNVLVDFNTGEITYEHNNIIYKLGYIKKDKDQEEVIYLTTTEIRMILRDSKTDIKEKIIDNKTINEGLKRHFSESDARLLELHTHFIEVLDAETFFEVLVKNDDYFIDPNKSKDDKDIYLVCGKNYTKQELIKALEYPLEYISGKEKENNGRGVKTLAFSELSKIVALRTNILKRDPRFLQKNNDDQNDSEKDKDNQDTNNTESKQKTKKKKTYDPIIEQDSKRILVARIRELLIASLKKLENEKIDYVELSYSRSDISTIFEPPIKPVEPKEPTKPIKEECKDYESEIQKYNEEYQKYLEAKERYEEEIKIYNVDNENYHNFNNELKRITTLKFRFLLSTQRDDWHKPGTLNNYFVPKDSLIIITHIINQINNIEDKDVKEQLLKDIIKDFLSKIGNEEFKAILAKRIELAYEGSTKQKINQKFNRIEPSISDDPDTLINTLVTALDNFANSSKSDSSTVILFNVLYEEMKYIQEISNRNPSIIDMTKIVDSESSKTNYIVGYDIMGYETKITNSEKIYLEQKIRRIINEYDPSDAKALHSKKRVIRIHAGETRESSGNVLTVLQIIEKIKNSLSNESGFNLLDIFEFRIGHGVYIYDNQNSADQVVDLLVKLGVIVEVNLSSNVALDNVDKITDVPILRYRTGSHQYNKEVKYVLSTDGGGVYRTSVTQEGLLECRYFPYNNTSTNSPNSKVLNNPKNNNNGSSNNNDEGTNSDEPIDIDNIESDNKLEEQVLNEYKNLIYVFIKDFSIHNILNFDDISAKIYDIEKSINNQNYKKAKIQIISLQVLMNSHTKFQQSYNNMERKVIKAKSMIYTILDSDILEKDTRIYATLRRINLMSDRDLMINYYNIFEKGDLISILKTLVQTLDFKKMLSDKNTEQTLSFSEDIDNAFYSNIKSKFAYMDDETIYRASDNLMLKTGEDKYKYIDSLIDTIYTIKQSNNIELAELKESLLDIDTEKIRYELEGRTKEDINEFVRDIFIKNRKVEELSELLSLRYKSIFESGKNITFEQFMKGDLGYDEGFNR